ncbi:hypothetical protein [Hoeflea sp.]|uniref:hypothetical protein n=1 Tax=Hoeflea sp. TaxID=1940281 RepID=UPI003A91EA5B
MVEGGAPFHRQIADMTQVIEQVLVQQFVAHAVSRIDICHRDGTPVIRAKPALQTGPKTSALAYELPSVGRHRPLYQQAAGLEFWLQSPGKPLSTPLSGKSWIRMCSRRAHHGLYEAPELFHT